MTNKEANKILAILKATYPAGFKDLGMEDLKALVGVWARTFKDWDYKLVSKAIDALIATNKTNFPPSPGAVMDQLIKITSAPEMTEMEAWQLVFKAIKRSGWYAQEEFDKLPAGLRSSVGSPEMLKSWSEMPVDTVQSVVQSNFMRTFRSKKMQEIEQKSLPRDTEDIILKLGEKFR